MSRILFLILLSGILFSCVSGNSDKKIGSAKYQQYYVQGEILYQNNCSNCHQADGTGLGRLYPPLNKSDFLTDNFAAVVCLMKNGVSGELLVNGVIYNQPMKGNPALTELEVAEIATYIYNTWTNEKGMIEVSAVTALLDSCRQNR